MVVIDVAVLDFVLGGSEYDAYGTLPPTRRKTPLNFGKNSGDLRVSHSIPSASQFEFAASSAAYHTYPNGITRDFSQLLVGDIEDSVEAQ